MLEYRATETAEHDSDGEREAGKNPAVLLPVSMAY